MLPAETWNSFEEPKNTPGVVAVPEGDIKRGAGALDDLLTMLGVDPQECQDHGGYDLLADSWREEYREKARLILSTLAPLREAERQEAVREALLAAAEAIDKRFEWDNLTRIQKAQVIVSKGNAVRQRPEVIVAWLRDRADGVTGRGEDGTR